MGTPFVAEVRIISFNYPPKGWAFCNGQLLSIQQNNALFSVIGTAYGGNGIQNFALPNLQGRTPVHTGGQLGDKIGIVGGEEFHTLSLGETPAHTHSLQGVSSGPEDFHLRALPEPYVNLSIHTAPVVRPLP